ncbi:RING finger protein B [Cyclospora cayetanensis]|uniref:RING finger protein B n=1 Tax=Cyclospora cayetanensis TaxID=88456 RepID=A0A6P6S2Z0_9EIME|nr:RING finger protein B [Cyclospora cayetanensis]
MFIFGGYSGSQWLNDLHTFDLGACSAYTALYGRESLRHRGGRRHEGFCESLCMHACDASEKEEWSELPHWGMKPSPRFGRMAFPMKKSCVLTGHNAPLWKSCHHAAVFLPTVRKSACFPCRFQAGGLPFSCAADFVENSPSASVWRAAAMRRYVAAANPLKGSILLFGGYDGCSWLNDLNQLNPQSLEWRPVHQRGLIPSGRSCPAAATHEQGLFLFGGYNGVERLSDLFSLCSRGAPPPAAAAATFEWRCIVGGRSAPSGRSSMVGVIYKNNFVVFGGYDGHPLSPPPSTLLSDLLSLQVPGVLADAVFLVEGRKVYSSRTLLACRSEHFRALFFGGLKEARDRATTPIPIEGIRHEVRL